MTVFQFCLDLELQIDPLLCILKTNITIPIKIVFKKKRNSKFANFSKFCFWILMILENWYFFTIQVDLKSSKSLSKLRTSKD